MNIKGLEGKVMKRVLETVDLVDVRADIVANIIKVLPLLSADGVKAVYESVDNSLDKISIFRRNLPE